MARKKLKILDIESELLIRIGNEKTESVPWDTLKEVGNKLESLLVTIGELAGHVDPNEIKQQYRLEFKGFYKGSAVPSFAFVSNSQMEIFKQNNNLTKDISVEFSSLMKEVSKGDFRGITKKYKNVEEKNEILKRVADFANSSGEYGMSIVERAKTGGFSQLYTMRTFSAKAIADLKSPVSKEDIKGEESIQAIANIIIKKNRSGRSTKKALSVFRDSETKIVMEYKSIEYEDRRYEFKMPEYFEVQSDGKATLMENTRLDLYASGKTTEDAKRELFYQFDHSYNRLMELDDSVLSNRLLAVKNYYKYIIKSVS